MLSQHTALTAFLIRFIAQSRASAAEYAPKTPWLTARNPAPAWPGRANLYGGPPALHAFLTVDQRQQRFEYVCHEGNHAMRHILSAARAADQESAQR